uniref:Ig-like domain-containing protein n=1 Tax=Steinernema glaseri TaxID=37863 RepID=A0A1I7Z2G9_9BILA
MALHIYGFRQHFISSGFLLEAELPSKMANPYEALLCRPCSSLTGPWLGMFANCLKKDRSLGFFWEYFLFVQAKKMNLTVNS